MFGTPLALCSVSSKKKQHQQQHSKVVVMNGLIQVKKTVNYKIGICIWTESKRYIFKCCFNVADDYESRYLIYLLIFPTGTDELQIYIEIFMFKKNVIIILYFIYIIWEISIF